MLPPHQRTIVKQITQAIEQAESRADDRNKRANESQKEVVVAIQYLAEEFKTYEAKQAEAERKKNRRESLTIASLIITAAITLALTVIAYLQWGTLEKQWETFEKTDHTLKDTLKANNASQRAFVLPDIDGLQFVPTAPNWTFRPEWENKGNTPRSGLRCKRIVLRQRHQLRTPTRWRNIDWKNTQSGNELWDPAAR